ncbi:MAG: tRNA (adenosine(37)-N6)-threonylcarbamoyltransferase complex dimerization subunit type 1 TsaB [Sulfuricaulis sp.]
MKILALDTSTEACSVALWTADSIVERFELGSQHSERILPMVHDVLAEAGLGLKQLDAIAFGRGPGSFTGLRISAGVVQGLAFGADLPVLPVSSLAALAQGAAALKVLAAFDARMNQVYWGAFIRNSQDVVELSGAERVLTPNDIPIPIDSGWIGAGSGWDQYSSVLMQRFNDHVLEWRAQCFPRARFVAQLGALAYARGEALAAEQALPVYVRDEIAAKQLKR